MFGAQANAGNMMSFDSDKPSTSPPGPRPSVIIPSAPIPQNQQVAGFYACLEWLRAQCASLPVSTEPFTVASVANGSPDFDKEACKLLASKFPKLRYTILLPARAYSRLESDAEVAPYITLHAATTLDEVDSKAGEGFDLIHTTFWRDQFATPADTLKHLSRLCSDRGTVLVSNWGTEGAFELRAAHREALKPERIASGSMTHEEVCKQLASVGSSYISVSELSSQVDITSALTGAPGAFMYRTLSDLFRCDLERAAAANDQLLGQLAAGLQAISISGDPARCVISTPMYIVAAAKCSKPRFLPASLTSDELNPWWPHGNKGGFFNVGLNNWLRNRADWREHSGTRVAKFQELPSSTYEDIFSNLCEVAREYQLPTKMPLSTLLDIYVEVWEDVGY